MKLTLLSLIFRFTGAGVAATAWLNRVADRLHQFVWSACTRENLRTCNIRDEPRAKRVGSGPWLGASGASPMQDAEPTPQANDHP